MKSFKWSLTCALLLGIASAPMAFPDRGEREHRHPLMNQRLQEKLNLTTEQASKIEAINHKYKLQQLEHEKIIAPLKIELKQHWINTNPNLDEVKATLIKISKEKTEIQFNAFKQMKELENCLTEDQKSSIKKLRHTHFKKIKSKNKDT